MIRSAQLSAFLSICLVASPTEAQRTLLPDPAPIGQLVDVGGYRVHLVCYGSGTPTVLIVGAGASFEWGLVTPAVARRTRVCAYDHSGTVWSDDGPPDACELRVHEVATALERAHIAGPFIVVGHSIGALVARLFAARYPLKTAGMVIVDHATDFPVRNVSLPAQSAPSATMVGGVGVPGRRVPIGENAFARLPSNELALHEWAAARPRDIASRERSPSILPKCKADLEHLTGARSEVLGQKPVTIMHVNSGEVITKTEGTSPYARLQQQLAALSLRSQLVQVEHSSHYMMLDRPDAVIDAILSAVEAVKR